MNTCLLILVREDRIPDLNTVRTLADIPEEAWAHAALIVNRGDKDLTLTSNIDGAVYFAVFERHEDKSRANFLGWIVDSNGKAQSLTLLKDGKVIISFLDTGAQWYATDLKQDVKGWKEMKNEWKRIADTERDGLRVSTVRLPYNHQWDSRKPPQLYETMVFGGEFEGEMDRYATLEEAQAGHERMVAKVFGGE